MKPPTIIEIHEWRKASVVSYLEGFCDVSKTKHWIKKSPSKGKAVTLVAHIDTAHERETGKGTVWCQTKREWVPIVPKPVDCTPKEVFFDPKRAILWSPEGLGADDRAGVFGIISIYNKLPDELKPNLLFCDEEESGCVGARQAVNESKEFLDSSLAFIELDRKNANDCVFYNDEPKDWVAFVEKYGFKKADGTVSDVRSIGMGTKICTVNLSCGYYREHTTSEFLRIAELFRTIERATRMVKDLNEAKTVWENPNAVEKPVTVYAGTYFDDDYYYNLYGESGVVGQRELYNRGRGYQTGGYRSVIAEDNVVRRDASLVGINGGKLSRKERRLARKEERKNSFTFNKDGTITTKDGLIIKPRYSEADYERNPYLNMLSWGERYEVIDPKNLKLIV